MASKPMKPRDSDFDAQSAVAAARNRGRRAKVIAALLASIIVLAASTFFLYERSVIERTSESNSVLYAKVLEDQTSRVMANVEVITLSLAEAIGGQADLRSVEALDALLSGSASGQGYLRSIALVSADGNIIASSAEGDRRGVTRWRHLGVLPAEGSGLRMGKLLAGRSLRDITEMAGRNDPAKTSVVLPLIRSVRHQTAEVSYLVVLLNLDYLANQHGQLVDDPRVVTALTSWTGELLTASANLKTFPGTSLATLPVFKDLLSRREHLSFRGEGLTGPDAIGAYRASRRYPLVVMVEESRASIEVQVHKEIGWIVGVSLLLMLLLAGSTWMIHNSSRRDEKLTHRLKNAYAQALEHESRKKSILEASLDAVISTDGQGRIMDFNPAAERMFGRKAMSERTKGLDVLILPKDVLASLPHRIEHYLSTSNSEALNRLVKVEARREDGTRFPIEFTFARVPMPEETFYTVTVRDISDRQRAERKLRESERRWKLALEAAGDAVWDWNIAGNIMLYSPQWLEMLGYAEGDVSLRHDAWAGLIHPDDSTLVSQAMIAHLDGRTQNFAAECRMRCKNGEWLWVHARGMVVERSKKSGKPLRLVGTNTDITDRKTAEAERAALLIKSNDLAREMKRARDTEIDVGSRIQRSLLLTPQNRRLSDLWVSSFNQASQGIDGDFVEVICPSEHAVDIIVGDVMGKGVNAALMGAAVKMQLSRSMIELMTDAARSGDLPAPSEVVRSVHLAVSPHLQALEIFVTLCYVRIDTRANTVTWVGCGHEEPMLIRHCTTPRNLANQHPPLGVIDKMDFVQGTAVMTALDSLFMHSDGVTDAVLANGERLGHDRLQAELVAHLNVHKTPAAVMHQVRRGLFSDGVRFTDDFTMVLAVRSDRGLVTQCVELESTMESIEPLRHLVMTEGVRVGLSEGDASLFTVAAVEAFTNIVRHAKGRLAGSPVEVLASRIDDCIELEMIYLADSFTINLSRPDPDLDDFPEGGFGTGIIRNVCDEYVCNHEDGVNTILMRKNLHRQEALPELV